MFVLVVTRIQPTILVQEIAARSINCHLNSNAQHVSKKNNIAMKIKLICFIALLMACSDSTENDHCVEIGLNLTRAFSDFNGDAGQQGRYNGDYYCAVLTDAQLPGIDFSSPYIPYNPHSQFPVCETGFTSPPQLCLTNLKNAEMARVNLSGANLSRVVLTGANLQGANLNRSLLYGAELYGARLQGADMRNTNATGAYLNGANLTGANLTGANLFGTDLRGANLDNVIGADYTGAIR